MLVFTDWFNFIVAAVTVLGMVTVVTYLSLLLISLRSEKAAHLVSLLERRLGGWIAEIGFVVSLLALVGTLIYSEVIAFDPCEFCWWQRIALYPQVIIYGVALIKKYFFRKQFNEYLTLLVLSLGGMVLASIHLFIQVTEDSIFCVPGVVSCSTVYVTEFGFITMPVMSLTVFATLALLAGTGLFLRKEASN